MQESHQALSWGSNVRFLSHANQVALVDLRRGCFIKLHSDAKNLIDLKLQGGSAALQAQTSHEERINLCRLMKRLQQDGYLVAVASQGEARKSQPFTLNLDDYRRRPKTAYYSASDRCNLSCSFCYVSPKRCDAPYDGDTDLAIRILDSLASLNVRHLVFSGGEPLLRGDITELIAHAKLLGMVPTMTTNGTLLNSTIAKRLVSAGLEQAQISIESASEDEHDALRGPGSYRKSVDAVHNLAAAGLSEDEIYVAATTTRSSLKTIASYWEFAKSIGATPSFSFYQPVGKALQTKRQHESSEAAQLQFMHDRIAHAKTNYEQEHSCCDTGGNCIFSTKIVNSCSMGFTTIAVKEDGEVVPCHLFLSERGFGIGNVLNPDIAERIVSFLNDLPTVDSINGCHKCQVRYFCGNGCWANTYWKYGTFRHKNPYCGFYQKFWSAMIWNLGAEDEVEAIMRDLKEGIEEAAF